MVEHALRQVGYSTWWDHNLDPHESWDKVIEREIENAKAVVVLWTSLSYRSDWVRSEARFAKQHRKLIPLRMEPCAIPLEFNSVQTAELVGWKGDVNDAQWTRAKSWIDRLIPAPTGRKLVDSPKSDSSVQSPRKDTQATSKSSATTAKASNTQIQVNLEKDGKSQSVFFDLSPGIDGFVGSGIPGGDQLSFSGQKREVVPRNAPCPCGSGKKYKHCHGAVVSPKSD